MVYVLSLLFCLFEEKRETENVECLHGMRYFYVNFGNFLKEVFFIV
jgi:hypothetical protein